MHPIRAFLGFLLAPLAGLFAMEVSWTLETHEVPSLGLLQYHMFFMGILAYGATILIGLPAFGLYESQQWKSGPAYGLGGLLVGLVVSLIYTQHSWSVRLAVLQHLQTIAAFTAPPIAFHWILNTRLLNFISKPWNSLQRKETEHDD